MKRKTKAMLRKEHNRIMSGFVIFSVFLALRGILPAKAQIATESAGSTEEVKTAVEAVSDAPKASQVANKGVPAGVPSQYQKDTVARVCGERFVGSVLSTCYRDVLAIAYTESRFDCSVLGDNGKARGCYQIWFQLHGITAQQAEDFDFATRWTLDRMVSQGYSTFRAWALGSHNSFTPDVNKAYSQIVKAKSAEFERVGL